MALTHLMQMQLDILNTLKYLEGLAIAPFQNVCHSLCPYFQCIQLKKVHFLALYSIGNVISLGEHLRLMNDETLGFSLSEMSMLVFAAFKIP